MYTHNGIANTADFSAAKSTQNFVKREIKTETVSLSGVGGNNRVKFNFHSQIDVKPPVLQTNYPHGVKRPGDPYEFDEEGGAACRMDGFKREPGGIKEEPKESSKKCSTGNLFTSEGLQPSYKDLDQIFDNSDDTSSDEAVRVFCYCFLNCRLQNSAFLF